MEHSTSWHIGDLNLLHWSSKLHLGSPLPHLQLFWSPNYELGPPPYYQLTHLLDSMFYCLKGGNLCTCISTNPLHFRKVICYKLHSCTLHIVLLTFQFQRRITWSSQGNSKMNPQGIQGVHNLFPSLQMV